MAKKRHLIIGCGSAALSALEEINKLTTGNEVKLVSMEGAPPYSPTSLPYLVSGRINYKDLFLRDESSFQNMNAELKTGKEVVKVQPREKQVLYRDGSSDNFDSLLIASGSEPIKPSIKGMALKNILLFHTLEDCQKLLAQLDKPKQVTLYGGGLVAVELAEALIEKGCQVNVVVRSWLMRRYFDKEASILIEEMFRNKGARIYSGVDISEVQTHPATENGHKVILSNGDSFNTDILVSCIGVNPRIYFLEKAGITLGNGVLVDKRMRTDVENIYAAGDVAEAPEFFSGSPGVNPILLSAVAQGKIAGKNMAGEAVEYEGNIPTNIIYPFGHIAFSAGLSTLQDGIAEVWKDSPAEEGNYKKLIFRQNRLIGALFINIAIDPGVFLYLIKKRLDLAPYKADLFENPLEMGRWIVQRSEREGTTSVKA